MLRFLRWILNRFLSICFVGLPLGLILWLGGGALSWIFGRSEFLDDVILYGIAAAAASFLLMWFLPKAVGWIEYLIALGLPIRRVRRDSGIDVLYLRPFSLDTRTAGGFISFEELLLRRLTMPVLAVSNPAAKEKVHVGARRVKLPSAPVPATDWHGHIVKMIAEARLVLIVFDETSGLLDELAILRQENALAKTALVVPFNDHWSWAAILETLPDEVIVDCLRQCPPSASTLTDLKHALKKLHLPDLNQRPRKSRMISEFRNSLQRAREQRAKETSHLPIEPLERLAHAECPTEMMLFLHAMIQERISGMTFGNHLRLWSRPAHPAKGSLQGQRSYGLLAQVVDIYRVVLIGNRGQSLWASELGDMVVKMFAHLSLSMKMTCQH